MIGFSIENGRDQAEQDKIVKFSIYPRLIQVRPTVPELTWLQWIEGQRNLQQQTCYRPTRLRLQVGRNLEESSQ